MSMIPQQPVPNQGAGASELLQGLQSEVTHEAAPLLQFLLQHAVAIMTLLGLFAIGLGGMATYQWYAEKSMKEGQNALARILISTQGTERLSALEKFSIDAPDAIRMAVLLELGGTAMEVKDYAKASTAYETAAASDKEGATGLLASYEHAHALLAGGKADAALNVLNALLPRLSETSSRHVLSTQVEAALAAGKPDIALKGCEDLLSKAQGPEKEYLESRVQALRAAMNK